MNLDFIIDIAMILVIVVWLVGFLIVFLRDNEKDGDTVAEFTYEFLCKRVKERVDELVGTNMMGMGLSKEELYNQEQQQQTISSWMRCCCSGDSGAREALKELVRTILITDCKINEEHILITIPFNHGKKMTARQLFEAMLYKLDGGKGEGLAKLCEQFGWGYPDEEDGYSITERMVRKAWSELRLKLNYADQLNVLTQMVYSDVYGLRVIDSLNEQVHSVEELQLGLCGLPEKAYHYKDELIGVSVEEKAEYSKDSVNTVLKGNCIRLPFLSFETDDEMERVIRNLIKNSGAGELTAKDPEKVIDTVDGRRISVARPPVADGYVGFVRKFDAIVGADLAYWCSGMKNSETVVEMLTWLMKAKQSLAITGDMGAGKTTVVRGLLAKADVELAIRTIESESFEVNVRRFLKGRNSLALRVAPETPEDRVLAFVRKTSGQIFCVGEITSPSMANLTLNLSKIAQQIILSAHYVTTDDMMAAFTGAKLSIGGYTSEKLAEMDVVRSLRFDVHVAKKNGVRYIQYINEIVPMFDLEARYDSEEITSDNVNLKVASGIREVRKQMGRMKTYAVRPIMEYHFESGALRILNKPSEETYKMAKQEFSSERYDSFVEFFNSVSPEGQGD